MSTRSRRRYWATETGGKAAGKQIDIIRKDFSDKETFAKELLYDAAAYKGLSEKSEQPAHPGADGGGSR